jgi:hypothetical protein
MSAAPELFQLRNAQLFLHPFASMNQHAQQQNGRQRALPAFDGEPCEMVSW